VDIIYSPGTTASRWLRRAAALAAVLLAVALVDTSCTPKPDCHQWPGTHAERMPSHQHYMWTCAPGGGVS
jgi:hypothetical protein